MPQKLHSLRSRRTSRSGVQTSRRSLSWPRAPGGSSRRWPVSTHGWSGSRLRCALAARRGRSARESSASGSGRSPSAKRLCAASSRRRLNASLRPNATSSVSGAARQPGDVGAADVSMLRTEARTLVDAADAAALRANEAVESARAAETARVEAGVRAGRRRARPHELARLVRAAERLDEATPGGGGRRRPLRSPAP